MIFLKYVFYYIKQRHNIQKGNNLLYVWKNFLIDSKQKIIRFNKD
jgi:hypothetical protein